MISTVTLAEDTTTTETCANGAGIVIEGAVADANGNKHKYCRSNQQMNWWNAVSWCDALGRRLFSLDDCAFSVTSTTTCNDLKGVVVGEVWIWTSTPSGDSNAYRVNLSSGTINGSRYRDNYLYALCY